MKAIIAEKFGPPDQLHLANVAIPEPKSNEVQIKVAYAGINPVDWKICEGYLKERLPHEFPIILGWDVAGTISKIGSDVTHLHEGDEVFAYTRKPVVHLGGFAEYICYDAIHVALKPKSLSLEQAASIPLTSLTAWQSINEAARLKNSETILIHAGAGGVGGMAIQFAKYIGAKILTTASSQHHPYVKQLGAELAIDYNQYDFVSKIKNLCPHGIDVVFDTVGNDTLQKSFEVLKQQGRLVSIVEQVSEKEAKQYGIHFSYVFVRPDGVQLKQIADLFDSGILVSPKVQSYPLEQAAEALNKLKEGHTEGKIVLKI